MNEEAIDTNESRRFFGSALDQRNVFALQQNTSDGLPGSGLDIELGGIFQHEIHVFIESDDMSFNAQVHILIQPNLNLGSILKVSKDQVDRLYHDLLDLLRGTFVRHCDAIVMICCLKVIDSISVG
jgi:hypothetical protein